MQHETEQPADLGGRRAALHARVADLKAEVLRLQQELVRVDHGPREAGADRQVEEQLRFQSMVLDQIQDRVTVTDLDGRITYVNEAGCRTLGRSREELLGQSIAVYGEDPHRGATQAEIVAATLLRGSWRGEVVNWTADGGKVFLECRTQLVHDSSGRPIAICGISTDITERKRAEESLRASEARFRGLFEHLPIAVWEEDFTAVKARFDELRQQGINDLQRYLDENPGEVAAMAARVRVVEINQASVEVLGAVDKAGVARALPRYFTTESMEAFRRELAALYAGRRSFRADIPIVNSAGQRMLLALTLSVQPEHEQTLERVIVSFADITESRHTEESLRESEARFRLLHELLPVAYQSLDGDGCILEVNPAWLAMMGYTRDEVLGRWFGDFLTVPMKAVFRERFEVFKRTGRTCVELDLVRKDGCARAVLFQGRTEADEGGRFQRTHCVGTDITDRRAAEQAMRQSEAKYRTIFENAPLGIFRSTPAGRFVEANPALARILGYESPEAVVSEVRDIASQIYVDNGLRQQILEQTTQTDEMGCFENRYRRRDGSEFVANLYLRMVRDEAGQPLYLEGIVEDISARRQIEAQYRQAQKMEAVGRLAAGVAHDINNQLTIIQGYAETLDRQCRAEDPLRGPLGEIMKATQRAQSTTGHLLTYSRKQVLRPEVFDPGEMLRELGEPVSRIIGEDIRLLIKVEPGVRPVAVDKAGLHQAIMNLVINARDAMPDGGEMVLRAAMVELDAAGAAQYADGRAGSFVLLEVCDSGIGMDRATLDRVYDPFFTTKEVGKGTGLGVPMVLGFISQSRGFMGLQSTVGKGTTAQVFLPPADGKPALPEPAAPCAPACPRGGTILVVEDEAALRQLVVSVLQEEGHTVLAADRPSSALATAASHRGAIDLLITDLVMPEMSGVKLAAQLKASRPLMAALLMSGYPGKTEEIAEEVLQKPFSLAKLIALVGQMLKRVSP